MALLTLLRGRLHTPSTRLVRTLMTQPSMRAPVVTLAALQARGVPLPTSLSSVVSRVPLGAPFSSAHGGHGSEHSGGGGHAQDHHGGGGHAGGHDGGIHFTRSAIVSPVGLACIAPMLAMMAHIALIPFSLQTTLIPLGTPDLLELNMADGVIPFDPLGFIVMGSLVLPMVLTPMLTIRKPNLNIPFLPLRHAVIASLSNRLWFDRIYNSFAVYLHASVISRMIAHIEYGFLALYPTPRMIESWAKRPGSGWIK